MTHIDLYHQASYEETENHGRLFETLERLVRLAYRRETGSRRNASVWHWDAGDWTGSPWVSTQQYRGSLVGVKAHGSSDYPVLADVSVWVTFDSQVHADDLAVLEERGREIMWAEEVQS